VFAYCCADTYGVLSLSLSVWSLVSLSVAHVLSLAFLRVLPSPSHTSSSSLSLSPSLSLSLSLSPVVSHLTCLFSLARVRPLSFLSLVPFFSYYPPLPTPPTASSSHLRASARCVVLLPSCRHTRFLRICFLPNLVKNPLPHSPLMHICNSWPVEGVPEMTCHLPRFHCTNPENWVEVLAVCA